MRIERHRMLGWAGLAVGVVAVAAVAQPPASSPPPAPASPQKMEPVTDPAAPSPEAKPEAAPAKQPTTAPAPAHPPAGDDPAKTMEDLERAAKSRPGGAAPAATSGAGTPGAGATGTVVQPAVRPFARLMREGAFLTSKRGRMVKSPEGEWLFVFDNDADSRAYPPMVIVPCLNLAAMERIAERAGDSATMTVSGQVFVYKGRNHLLPALFTVDRKTELAPNG